MYLLEVCTVYLLEVCTLCLLDFPFYLRYIVTSLLFRPGAGNTYTFPVSINGSKSYEPLVTMATPPAERTPAPHDLQSKHKWDTGTAPDWQHPDAVSAIALGCKGDGTTDDYVAL